MARPPLAVLAVKSHHLGGKQPGSANGQAINDGYKEEFLVSDSRPMHWFSHIRTASKMHLTCLDQLLHGLNMPCMLKWPRGTQILTLLLSSCINHLIDTSYLRLMGSIRVD